MSQYENEIVACGDIEENKEIKSSLGPFRTLPDYTIIYPKVVVESLCNLYEEYNKSFVSMVKANCESDADYNFCMSDGIPINYCVQIDMVGLSKKELERLSNMSETEVREILRKKIFEIENSIAMYQLLEKMFPGNGNGNGSDSFFKTHFRAILEDLRRRFGRSIALLAITEEKYEAMLASEFGGKSGKELTDKEVKDLSGFDVFFSPQQFCEYLSNNNNKCEYLLYVRSSDPLAKLRKPNLVVDHPLLSDSNMRGIIKTNALTLNIDAPDMEYSMRINDTKDYMGEMTMGFLFNSIDDLSSNRFGAYLRTYGIALEDVVSGRVAIRCKPAKGAYGCYGHVSGFFTDRKFRKELKRNLRLRGNYVAQVEMETPVIVNSDSGMELTYIDRNFIGMIDGHPQFIGGVRNLIPAETTEAREHRIHGNSLAVYAEIRDTSL